MHLSGNMVSKKKWKYIAVHAAVWILFFVVLNYQVYSEIRYVPVEILYRTLYRSLINIALFYLNYAYLVPKFLLKKKLRKYVFISLSIIVLNVVLIGGFDSPPPGAVIIAERMDAPPGMESGSVSESVRAGHDSIRPQRGVNIRRYDDIPHPGMEPEWHKAHATRAAENFGRTQMWRFRLLMSLRAAMVVAMYFVIGAAIKIYMEWKKGEALRHQIQSEKVTSELQFLKAQLNPHFLFNSLNSIYSLSVKKSNDTPEAVITLSDLMRYMLYEANRDLVPLSKEIEYIKNYIKLQRLRLSDGEQVTLNIYGDDRDKKIQPLLFISFIENAFKYGTDYRGRTVVKTVISIKEDAIHFYIRNIIGRYKKNDESSGVGLQNIRNRLNLLYPDSHTLDITDDGEAFTVSLTLKFDKT
ncbi:Histidine kinase [Sinomicrobium oceani]|uniref:Histidine kinase n=1 Tax=Sinomicrobium oceani TaxID=1150368 RepID=A0A1K1QRM4_9FLAO|nr:sensor histidine kinase [Sinomicrobium oceani]SFW62594.1 Histidine kinase [Sinomicrobium oceani]